MRKAHPCRATILKGLMSVMAVVLLTSACAEEELPEEVTPAAIIEDGLAEEVLPPAVTAEWQCGVLKERIYAIVNYLTTPQGEFSAEPPIVETDQLIANEEYAESFEAAQMGFSGADQEALEAACDLSGRHSLAIQLYITGIPEKISDACHIWLPAKQHSLEMQQQIDIASLNPIVGQFWTGATGDIAEGHGRCLAEEAN